MHIKKRHAKTEDHNKRLVLCVDRALVVFIPLKVRKSRNVFFLAEDSSKKRTKTRRILVEMNSFVRFLEESLA